MSDNVTHTDGQARQARQESALRRWPLLSAIEFGPLPTAISCARLHGRLVLAEWDLRDLANDAELLISELMTNALHVSEETHQPIALCLRSDRQRLIIEVWDRCPDDLPDDLPMITDGADTESGHGLMIVDAVSARWGSARTGYAAKVVWAELAREPAPACA